MRCTVMLATTFLFCAALAAPASAQTTFTGQDDDSAVGGAMPVSTAAATSFLASAGTYGSVITVNFDALATSDANTLTVGDLTITKSVQAGNGYSGVSDISSGNLYGYDQSAGGAGKWYGFASGSATFTFAAPTHSFGFYISGTQTIFGTAFTVVVNGVTFNAPINVNGGAGFFGFTSSTAFGSAVVSRPGTDAWGIDNVSYNGAAVPEPAAWALMIVGVSAVGGALRRRRTPTVRYA